RKLAGDGSLVITVCDDGSGDRAQWILGGWNNKQYGIQTHFAEQDQLLNQVPGSIENNRWYEIKIMVTGAKMECYLDGKLIQSAEILSRKIPSLFASAARDEKTGETILKVVNPGNEALTADLFLHTAGKVESTAQASVLEGKPSDENLLGKPAQVSPVTKT